MPPGQDELKGSGSCVELKNILHIPRANTLTWRYFRDLMINDRINDRAYANEILAFLRDSRGE